MNEQVCPLPKCALLLRYQLSPSPCQGNTACHHHLPPIQTFPCHQCATCITYGLSRGVKCFSQVGQKTKFCMRPPFRPVLDSLYRLSLTSLRLAGRQLIADLAKLAFDQVWAGSKFPFQLFIGSCPSIIQPSPSQHNMWLLHEKTDKILIWDKI